jgi:hypothetical protein
MPSYKHHAAETGAPFRAPYQSPRGTPYNGAAPAGYIDRRSDIAVPGTSLATATDGMQSDLTATDAAHRSTAPDRPPTHDGPIAAASRTVTAKVAPGPGGLPDLPMSGNVITGWGQLGPSITQAAVR